MKMLKKINIPIPLFIFLTFLSIIRFTFLGKGALGISDEWRYDESLRLLSFLAKQDFANFFNTISNTQGRPADVLIRLPDALLQTLFFKITGLEIYHPSSLIIPTTINIVVNFFIAILFYKIAYLCLRKDATFALYASIVFCMLVNNNVYIRHIVPYDYGLLFFFSALYFILKNTHRSYFFISGFFSALSFAIYPGYYVGVGVVFLLALFIIIKHHKNRILNQIFFFGSGFASLILFFEGLHQISKKSYILNLVYLSSSIIQGSFEEGFSFIFKYLLENDYLTGFLLILASFLALFKGLYRIFKEKKELSISPTDVILVAVLAMFLFHASMTFFFQKMVFYGRLAHFYFPFMVLSAFIGFQNMKAKKIIPIFFVISACFSFIYFTYRFQNINYPRDVAAQHRLLVTFGDPLLRPQPAIPQIIDETQLASFKIIDIPKNTNHFKLINFSYFYPLEKEYKVYEPVVDEELVFQAIHFQSFTPYLFEGFNPKERAEAKKRQMKIKIYRTRK